MEAIILAGGIGSRLQSVVADVPKPMAPVAGRPFLEYLLEHASRNGVTRAILAVGYKHEIIQDHFGDRFGGINIAYSIERERLGTGGCIRLALPQVDDEDFLVLNGDTCFLVPLRELLSGHVSGGWDMTIALKRMDDCKRYGSVELDPTGRISGWHEKRSNHAGLINAGIYCINRRWFASLQTPEVFSLEREIMEAQAAHHGLGGRPFDAYFIDIGIPQDYDRAQSELPSKLR